MLVRALVYKRAGKTSDVYVDGETLDECNEKCKKGEFEDVIDEYDDDDNEDYEVVEIKVIE